MDISKVIDRLKEYLPHNYNTAEDSNISKLISILKEELTEIREEKENLEYHKDLDVAEGVFLDRLGANIGQERGSLDDEQYRILIKSKIQQNLSPGDINSLLGYISSILDVDRQKITITNNVDGEPAFFQFEVETQYLMDAGISLENIYDILSQLKPAGVKLRGYSRGSFQFAPELKGIFKFASTDESEYDIDTGFSSEKNYATSGGKFLTAINSIDPKKGFANIEKNTGGFFGSVI